MTTKRMCYHPGWPPYNPMTGEKIQPAEIWECKCGMNWGCPVCGFGGGAWPCDCSKSPTVEEAVDKYKELFKEAWPRGRSDEFDLS